MGTVGIFFSCLMILLAILQFFKPDYALFLTRLRLLPQGLDIKKRKNFKEQQRMYALFGLMLGLLLLTLSLKLYTLEHEPSALERQLIKQHEDLKRIEERVELRYQDMNLHIKNLTSDVQNIELRNCGSNGYTASHLNIPIEEYDFLFLLAPLETVSYKGELQPNEEKVIPFTFRKDYVTYCKGENPKQICSEPWAELTCQSTVLVIDGERVEVPKLTIKQ